MIEWKNDWIYNIFVTECQFVSYNNLIIVIHCIQWASFIHSCIDWLIELHSKSVNWSASLSMVVENKRKMNEWSFGSRFVAHRFWEMLRNEDHWTDLVLFIQSHKYPLQFTLLVHSINYSVLSASTIHFMYNMCLITVYTHFKTIFAGLLIHFQLWMIEIESDLDITTNHIPIHFHYFSYNFLCYNQI